MPHMDVRSRDVNGNPTCVVYTETDEERAARLLAADKETKKTVNWDLLYEVSRDWFGLETV